MENRTQLTNTEQTTLVAALEAALRVAAKERSADNGLFFQILALRDNPETAIKELRELLANVESMPALEFFNSARTTTHQRHETADETCVLREEPPKV